MKRPIIAVTTSYANINDLENQTVNPFYLDAIVKAGGEPRLLDFLFPTTEVTAMIEDASGVLVIGGDDIEPSLYGCEREKECGESCIIRDEFEMEVVRMAHILGIPLLGICRGVQVLNTAMGGTLIQHVPAVTGVNHQQKSGNVFWHDVDITPGTILSEIVGTDRIAVNSYHHQAPMQIAPGLRVAAKSRDGIIEALESLPGEPWQLGVQWHPERTVGKDKYSLRYFEALVNAPLAP